MSFLTISDLLLPPPLAAAAAACICAGIWWLGDFSSRFIWGQPSVVQRSAGFALAAATVAFVVNLLALGQSIPLWLLRSIALLLCLLGLSKCYTWAKSAGDLLRGSLSITGWLNRIGWLLCGVTLLSLLLAALGPATDADSLDYHLGVPLDWIRHGGAYPRADWLHARLVGLGESINLLGLAAGTDSLGAVMQFSGLIVAWRAIVALSQDDRSRVLASLLVLTCPMLLFLVPNQKPQLVAAAPIVVSLILLANKSILDKRDLVVVLFILSFAIATKYSMLLSGGVVVCYALYRAWRHEMLRFALLALALASLLLVGPIYLRNLTFYGDPLSPFLERFKPNPDPQIGLFAIYLRGFGGGIGFDRFVRLPLEWLFSPNLVVGSNVFGIGLLAFLVIKRCNRTCVVLLGCAGAMLCLQLLLSQVTARFFFEGFLLICAAVAVTPWDSRKELFQRILTLQSGATAAMALYAAAVLFPGSFSEARRNSVMSETAHHYEASRWLDEVLPQDVLLLADMRTNALLPRPSRASTEFAFVRTAVYLEGLARIASSNDRVAVVRYHAPASPFRELERCSSRLVGEAREFDYVSRNPLFRREAGSYSLMALELQPEKPGCPWVNASAADDFRP